MHIYRPLLGSILIVLLCINTTLWASPVILIGILKLIPISKWQTLCTKCVTFFANTWLSINNFFIDLTLSTTWQIRGLEKTEKKQWCLVIPNHQSWLDIVVLQKIFQKKIPYLKFFLKKELKWIPFLNIAWWALDFPYMKRYSKEFLQKNPHLKGKDIETTRRSCARFVNQPSAILNFVEGTRFSLEKKRKQSSTYQNLLPPRAGGIAYVLFCMGEKLQQIIDVTIVYPDKKTLWDFLCNRVKRIHVDIKMIPISPNMIGDYINDKAFQKRFQACLNHHWENKDKLITQMLHPNFAAEKSRSQEGAAH